MWIWIISFNSNAQRSLRKKQGLQGLKMLDDSRETIFEEQKGCPYEIKQLWQQAQDFSNHKIEKI